MAAQIASGNASPIARVQRHLKDADGSEGREALPGNGQVLNGRLQSEDDSEITVQQVHSAAWSAENARVGDEVTISAAAPGIEDGTEVLICIEQLSRDGTGSDTAEVLQTTVSGEKIEATWAYGTSYGQTEAPDSVDSNRPVSDQMPIYRADIAVPLVGLRRSTGLLSYQSTFKMQVRRPSSGEPVAGLPYRLLLTSDDVREGETNSDGWIEEDEVPPGDHEIVW